MTLEHVALFVTVKICETYFFPYIHVSSGSTKYAMYLIPFSQASIQGWIHLQTKNEAL